MGAPGQKSRRAAARRRAPCKETSMRYLALLCALLFLMIGAMANTNQATKNTNDLQYLANAVTCIDPQSQQALMGNGTNATALTDLKTATQYPGTATLGSDVLFTSSAIRQTTSVGDHNGLEVCDFNWPTGACQQTMGKNCDHANRGTCLTSG